MLTVSSAGGDAPARQAAITGLGIISCIGTSTEEVVESLRTGASGVVYDETRAAHGFRSPLAGCIRGFDPKERGLNRKQLRSMDEPARYSYAAVMDALADAGLDRDDIRSERCGIVFGNDSCIGPSVAAVDIARDAGETHPIGGGYIFRTMNSTITLNLGALLGLGGASWTLSAACASGGHALGQAAMLVTAGLQDIVLAGAAQETGWESMASFDALGAFSLRTGEPERASRPFDAERDGLVPSGGAACLVVEDLGHARARNASVYGVIRGYGFSSDGSGHLTQPNVTGGIRAIRMALASAGIEAGDVDYVNAHATSTPVGDSAEAAAISEVFGASVPVSSTKSMTGHECWMAGASEALYTTLMAKHGFIAPNINFEALDEGSPPINVVREALEAPIRFAVSNSFGFGGTNSVIVLDYGDNAVQPKG